MESQLKTNKVLRFFEKSIFVTLQGINPNWDYEFYIATFGRNHKNYNDNGQNPFKV